MKKLLLVLALIGMVVLTAYGVSGTTTTNGFFYLPGYGSYGLEEYNAYNAYMEIADNAIKDNETAVAAITEDVVEAYIFDADAETILGNWVNTTHPWADNEVSDTLTASNLVSGASVVSDAEVDNDITIDLATLATSFTATDNEAEALACPIVFVDGATGAQGAETDGDLTYTPSTGTLTSTIFAGALSGNATTCTTASSGDTAVDFFGAGVTAVTDATTCTDIEGTLLSIGGTTLNAAIPEDHINATMLKDDNAPADEDIFSYELTGTTGHWYSRAEVGIGVATSITDGLIVEADLNADEDPTDNDILTFDTTGDNFSWQTLLELGIQPLDTALTNISALVYVSPSYIELTGDDTYAVRTLAQVKTDLAYQLSDMSDVGDTTPTNTYALMADGDSWESRAITSDDLSDRATIAMTDENETITTAWTFTNNINVDRANDTAAYSPYYAVRRSMDGDAMAENDYLGSYVFYGYHTDDYQLGATIRAIVDGDPGDNDMPTRLEFCTSADGSIVPTLAMTIDSDQIVTFANDLADSEISDTLTSSSCTGNAATVTGFTPASGSLTLAGADALTLTTTGETNATLPLGTNTLYSTLADSISSANLLSSMSDETGTGALVFGTSPTITTPVINHNVTAKTTTATLNIAESGLITVTAASGYTILLPTAVGNSGIVFTIKKTDDNANLITIDADGTETIDGALTYTDLNYQYAYVTIISDNSNWLVIGESTVKGGTF